MIARTRSRPDISPEDTKRILDEFERVKLLFRWTEPTSGKRWGYWIGIEKSGRLPAESRRGTHEVIGPEPPKDQLQAFLGHGVKPLAEERLANGNHTGSNGQPDGTDLRLGLGSGLGSGKGNLPPTPLQQSEGGWKDIFSRLQVALKSDLSTSFVNSKNFEESDYDRYFRDMHLASVSGDTIFVEGEDPETLAKGLEKFSSRLRSTMKRVSGQDCRFRVAARGGSEGPVRVPPASCSLDSADNGRKPVAART